MEKRKHRKIVFFVVHGLEANPFDMRHIRAAILTNIPNSSVHLIQKNYNLTNECISKQGRRFANEVLNYFNLKQVSGTPNSKTTLSSRLWATLWGDSSSEKASSTSRKSATNCFFS